jgi:hypothetical protein
MSNTLRLREKQHKFGRAETLQRVCVVQRALSKRTVVDGALVSTLTDPILEKNPTTHTSWSIGAPRTGALPRGTPTGRSPRCSSDALCVAPRRLEGCRGPLETRVWFSAQVDSATMGSGARLPANPPHLLVFLRAVWNSALVAVGLALRSAV